MGGGRKKSARELFNGTSLLSSSDGGLPVIGSCVVRLWPGVIFTLLLLGVYLLGTKLGERKMVQGGGGSGVSGENATSYYKVFSGGEELLGKEDGTTAEEESTTAAAGGSFTLKHLKATRVEAKKIALLLEKYYFGNEQAHKMLMTPWAAVWDFGAGEARPGFDDRTAKLVNTIARALITNEQKTFLMGGIGSSVMAGHNNCHYNSYQTQMERLWRLWGLTLCSRTPARGGAAATSTTTSIFA